MGPRLRGDDGESAASYHSMSPYAKAHDVNNLLLKYRTGQSQTTVVPAKAGTHKPMDKTFYVCMLASTRDDTLYIGVTSDLIHGKNVESFHTIPPACMHVIAI